MGRASQENIYHVYMPPCLESRVVVSLLSISSADEQTNHSTTHTARWTKKKNVKTLRTAPNPLDLAFQPFLVCGFIFLSFFLVFGSLVILWFCSFVLSCSTTLLLLFLWPWIEFEAQTWPPEDAIAKLTKIMKHIQTSSLLIRDKFLWHGSLGFHFFCCFPGCRPQSRPEEAHVVPFFCSIQSRSNRCYDGCWWVARWDAVGLCHGFLPVPTTKARSGTSKSDVCLFLRLAHSDSGQTLPWYKRCRIFWYYDSTACFFLSLRILMSDGNKSKGIRAVIITKNQD